MGTGVNLTCLFKWGFLEITQTVNLKRKKNKKEKYFFWEQESTKVHLDQFSPEYFQFYIFYNKIFYLVLYNILFCFILQNQSRNFMNLNRVWNALKTGFIWA